MSRLMLIAVLIFILAPVLVGAQVRYKDDEGTWHWVNSVDEVPQKYRAGAVGGPVPPAQPSLRERTQSGRQYQAK